MPKPIILLTGLEETCHRFKIKMTDYQPLIFPLQEAKKLTYQIPQDKFDWLLFTSPKAIEFFPNDFPSTKIITIGETTKKLVQKKFPRATILQPPQANSLSLSKFLQALPEIQRQKLLHPCSDLTDDFLKKELTFLSYHPLQAYTLKPLAKKPLPKHDAIYFFSPSAVKVFIHYYPSYDYKHKKIFSLGETTQKAIASLIDN